MAAATDLALIPAPARPRLRAVPDCEPGTRIIAVGDDNGPGAVVLLHRPGARSVAAPLRLTRRGLVVLGAVTTALAAAVVWLAWLSAPSVAGGPQARPPASVTVHQGDTLWSIAGRVAPGKDPRAEVDTLMHLNHLHGVDLVAGQVLRTR